MPRLEQYSKELDYSYALGLYPSRVCLVHRPELARRLLLDSDARGEGVDAVAALAESVGVRVEYAGAKLARLIRGTSGVKENIFAACVFGKPEGALSGQADHVALVNPSDSGNLGSIARSMAAVGYGQLAIIKPAVDPYDPKAVRASMGALLLVNIKTYDDFDAYAAEFPDNHIYPFMLASTATPLSSLKLERLEDIKSKTNNCLVFGNEGAGLPEAFSRIGTPVMIEQSPLVDSLNLACAVSIALHMFSRKS